MKKHFKRILCVFCAFLVLVPALSSVASAAYPDGITSGNCENALKGTDALLGNAIPALTGKTLAELVSGTLYSSETLSALLKGFYGAMQESSTEISLLGIDTSVAKAAECLEAYPSVAGALSKASDWNGVDLTDADWGVSDRDGFIKALGCIFAPLNDVLYMLLCGGSYKIAFITVNGNANGYQNGIVPLLKAAGCEDYLSQKEFTENADKDKNSMIENVIGPLLTKIENSLDEPATKLTVVLTNIAYFNESGGFKSSMKALLAPILDNPLVEIAEFLKILNLDDTFDLNVMINNIITQTSEGGGIKLPEVKLSVLAACGSENGGVFTPDLPAAYCEILRWLVEALKLNSDKLPQLLSQGGENTVAIPQEMLDSFLAKDTEELTKAVIRLFDPADLPAPAAMVYPAHTPLTVTYTPNLKKENYDKVLDEIDGILDQLVKDSFGYSSVHSYLSSMLYTNANINRVVSTVYSELEKQGLTDTLRLLGLDISPAGVADFLDESDFSTVRAVLLKAKKWSDVKLSGVTWGFYNGSRGGFEDALTAVLRPLFPLLRLVLAGEDLVILGGIKLKGGDGYNSAVIPLLEALGCEADTIVPYDKYVANANTDKIIVNVLDPVFDLLDSVFDRPVYTLTGILPNIVYFLNSGSLEKCLENLLLPVTALADTFSFDMGVISDTSALTEKLDVKQLASGLTANIGINTAELDFNSLSGYGEAKKLASKSVLDGKNQECTYIEADRTAVLMVFLRFLADTIKAPGNENLLGGAMGGDSGAFAQYSGDVFKQFEDMTSDELIEWLYNLLFKERVKVVIEENDDYTPRIIFEKQKKNYTPFIIGGSVAGVEAVIWIIIYFNRKKMFYA